MTSPLNWSNWFANTGTLGEFPTRYWCISHFYLQSCNQELYLPGWTSKKHAFLLWYFNRPLALRGHMTNASFGILLMPKIDRAHKNYLTPEIWEDTHLRKIFYGTLIFQQSSMICIRRHVGGHTLALQHGSQNYVLLIFC